MSAHHPHQSVRVRIRPGSWLLAIVLALLAWLLIGLVIGLVIWWLV